MNDFKIGDICIMQDCAPENLGEECEIIGALKARLSPHDDQMKYTYMVKIGDKKYLAYPHQLREPVTVDDIAYIVMLDLIRRTKERMNE